jgi:uncharacterized protein YlaI
VIENDFSGIQKLKLRNQGFWSEIHLLIGFNFAKQNIEDRETFTLSRMKNRKMSVYQTQFCQGMPRQSSISTKSRLADGMDFSDQPAVSVQCNRRTADSVDIRSIRGG